MPKLLTAFYKCAFCYKMAEDVKYLIQSQLEPTICICDKCVETCNKILNDQKENK